MKVKCTFATVNGKCMNPINTICYDIKSGVVKNIMYAAQKNKMVNMLGAFDDQDLLINCLKEHNNIGIIIIGLLTNESTSLYFVKKILKINPSAILVAYTFIESKFIIDSLIDEGVANVFHKSQSHEVVISKAIEIYQNKIAR